MDMLQSGQMSEMSLEGAELKGRDRYNTNEPAHEHYVNTAAINDYSHSLRIQRNWGFVTVLRTFGSQ